MPENNDTRIVLQCFECFVEFLLNEDAEAACGAKLHEQSANRLNYRSGYHTRRLITNIGTARVRVPHFKHRDMCPPLIKRLKRLSGHIVESLGHCLRVRSDRIRMAGLIKELWVRELPEALHSALTAKSMALLETFRRDCSPAENCEPQTANFASPPGYAVY